MGARQPIPVNEVPPVPAQPVIELKCAGRSVFRLNKQEIDASLIRSVPQRGPDYRKMFEIASSILPILAIVFAVVQFIDSFILKKETEHVVQDSWTLKKEMRHVVQSLSTQYIAEFPWNMEEINRVVSSAKEELDVMVDAAAYGQYSSPKLSEDYIQDILKLRPDVTVKMLVYDDASAKESRKRQFEGQTFEQIKTDKRFAHYFHDLYPRLGEPKNKQEFIDKLQERHQQNENRLLDKGVEIRHVSGRLFFYLWLADNQEGIFSFQNNRIQSGDTASSEAKKEQEISFRTRDGTLIGNFQNTFKQMWAAANKSNPIPIN